MSQDILAWNAEELLEHVREDDDLLPEEKEFNLHFTKADERATVATDIRGITRRMLQLPDLKLDHLRVSDDDRFGARVSPSAFFEGTITGLKGSVPIGSVKLQTSARATSSWAEIVSEEVLRGGGESK